MTLGAQRVLQGCMGKPALQGQEKRKSEQPYRERLAPERGQPFLHPGKAVGRGVLTVFFLRGFSVTGSFCGCVRTLAQQIWQLQTAV